MHIELMIHYPVTQVLLGTPWHLATDSHSVFGHFSIPAWTFTFCTCPHWITFYKTKNPNKPTTHLIPIYHFAFQTSCPKRLQLLQVLCHLRTQQASISATISLVKILKCKTEHPIQDSLSIWKQAANIYWTLYQLPMCSANRFTRGLYMSFHLKRSHRAASQNTYWNENTGYLLLPTRLITPWQKEHR